MEQTPADARGAPSGALSRLTALFAFAAQLRRAWGVTAVREMARHRLARIPLIGATRGTRLAQVFVCATRLCLCRRVGHHIHPTRSPGRACLPGLRILNLTRGFGPFDVGGESGPFVPFGEPLSDEPGARPGRGLQSFREPSPEGKGLSVEEVAREFSPPLVFVFDASFASRGAEKARKLELERLERLSQREGAP
eukprot:scaffold6516_cov126-Isochrysis_galbana.AAC.4